MECFGKLWSQEVFKVSHGSMSVFHDSRLVFMVFHGSGWFISEMSAGGAK